MGEIIFGKKALDSIKENKQIKQVHIDLFSVNSDEEFYNAYTKEVLKASSNKFKEWISLSKEFFKSLIPKFQFSPDSDTEFSLSFDYESTKNDPSEILILKELLKRRR
jgi:tRNA A37 threonylcarbamoyladenosine biosynthesis protein TsaE